MGFVYSANSLCTALFLTRDEIKKAQHLWRCAPLNVLTQGSSLRSPTLDYQKRNPDGVRLSHELPLRPLFLLKWLSKAEGDGIRQFANILCVPLPFEIAIKNIPQWEASSSQILQTSSAGAPLSLERGWG